MKRKILILFIILVFINKSNAYWNAIYQYGIDIPKPINDPFITGKTSAFLWIPPSAKHIRAVILAPANIIERRFCDDSVIRSEAERDGIALLYFQAGWTKNIFEHARLVTYIQSILDTLAAKSGYSELKSVPWIPIGHSGNSQFCQGIARQQPNRILADIIIKGALPGLPKDSITKGIAGIPFLFFTGEFEEVMPPGRVRNAWWEVQMKRFADIKTVIPKALISGMEHKGHGHISWTHDLSQYCALFIHKAIESRIDTTNQLKEVAYESGWLADPNEMTKSAAVNNYKGNKQKAFWFFDGEMAKQWKIIFDHDKGKKEQLLAFTQGDSIAPWWKGWGVQEIVYQPIEDDGNSFSVNAIFRKEVPRPFADSGTLVGHSQNEDIKYSVAGWASNIEQKGSNKFRIRFDREGMNGRTTHIVIAATHQGDEQYRETEAAAHFFLPPNSTGTKQEISFDSLPNMDRNTSLVSMKAKVSSGMQPDYYVNWGPAEIIDGNILRIKEIPANTKYPIEVKVSAYHFGRATPPLYASSKVVSRVFYILKQK